jgi:hypothetical protein
VVLLALIPLVSGVIALVAPDFFYEEIGRYGARNTHYVGDVGAFLTAFGAALLASAAVPAWRVPLLVLGGGYYALHALNHVFDMDEARSDLRGTADTVLIAIGAGLHLLLARMEARRR